MESKTKNKIRPVHPVMYRYHQHHLSRHPLHLRVLFYLLSFAILGLVVTYLSSDFQSVDPRSLLGVFSRIAPTQLLLYAGLTFSRLFIAYAIGLLISLLILLLVMSHRRIENFLVPILDILQSVPVLAFFPLVIVAFARLNLPELAAQIVLIVAMTWPVTFGALGGYHQIPEDIMEASQIYGASGFTKFRKVILPAIFPNLVTGSILSWGGGWNVIIISEYINYGDIRIRLPGLGNLLSSSAGRDGGVFLVALITLVLVIIIVDRLVWQRLLNYSEKYRFE